MYNDLTNQRIRSIDVFRGITILVMIFVNDLAGVSGIPAWMKHKPADADAMTFVDLVFPAFLFIVGMSLPFGINNRLGSIQICAVFFQHKEQGTAKFTQRVSAETPYPMFSALKFGASRNCIATFIDTPSLRIRTTNTYFYV